MTNVVTRDGYNIPKLFYDGPLNVSNVVVGDAEDFERLKDQVSRSGVFVIKKNDPSQTESFFYANVDTSTSIQGYRVYPSATGMTVLFVTISSPPNRPTEMLYTAVLKAFTAAT